MNREGARMPAWAGQRAATVEQRALQVEAELRRCFGAGFSINPRLAHELRQALAATWDDGEACGERTRDRPAEEHPVPVWKIPGRGEVP